MKTTQKSLGTVKFPTSTSRFSAPKRFILTGSIAAAMALTGMSQAATPVWDGFSIPLTPNWTASGVLGNWTSGAAPLAGDNLQFSASPVSAVNSNDFAAGTSFNSITFNAGAVTAYTLNGNAITLGAGGIANLNTATNGINFGGTGVTLGASQSFNASAGGLSITSAVNTNGNNLTVTGSNNTSLNGTVSGSGNLVKTGSGTLFVNTSASYGGATKIQDGTLQVGTFNALPTGTAVTINGPSGLGTAILDLDGFNQSITSLTFVAPAFPGVSIVNLNGGTLTVNGDIAVLDNTTVPGNGFGSSINGDGNLDLGGGVRDINVASQSIGLGRDLVISAVIQNGGVNINGTNSGTQGTIGGVEFSGANTYSDITTINSGVLLASNNSALGGITLQDGPSLPNLGSVVKNGGSLVLNDGVTINGEALTINGPGAAQNGIQEITNPIGALAVSEAGTATFGGDILVATSAAISSNGGTLNLNGQIAKQGVNLTLNGNGLSEFGFLGGTINVNGSIVGNSGSFNSDLIVDGTTANLNAANSYIGNTFIRSTGSVTGTINANVLNALPNSTDVNINNRTTMTLSDAGSSGAAVLNLNNGVFQAVQWLQSPVNSGTITSTVNLNQSALFIGNTGGVGDTHTFGGVINGGALSSLIKDGTNTQILTGTNTYIGQTRVTSGVLQIGDGTVTNSSIANSVPVVVDAPGTLNVDLANGETFTNGVTNNGKIVSITANTQTLSGVLSGTGTFTQTNGGTAILTNNNSYQGGTIIDPNGTVQIGAGALAGSAGTGLISVDDGATLELVNVQGNVLSNNITNNGSGTGTVEGSLIGLVPTRLTGTITDGAGVIQLTQNGPGTLILANTGNTYTGANTITGGILQIGETVVAGSIGGAEVTVGGGGSLSIVNIGGPTANQLDNNVTGATGNGTLNVNSANTNLIAGTLADGTGTLKVTQTGTGTTIIGADNTYSAGTTISAGVLQVGNNAAAGTLGSGNVVNNATLNFNRSDTNTFANNISGSGAVNKNNANILTVSGNNSYSGLTTVNGGALVLGSATALGTAATGTVVTSGATLDLNGQAVGSEAVQLAGAGGAGYNGALANNSGTAASLGGAVTLTADTTISTVGDITLNGVVGGAFNLTKVDTGTLTLNAVNSYTGTTFIQQGIVIAGDANALGSISNGTVVSSGAALSLANGILSAVEPLTINGAGAGVAAPGALTQASGGTSTFNGPITVASDSTINANGGTLTLNGTITKTSVDLTLAGTGAGASVINVNGVISGNSGSFNSDLIVNGTTANLNVANTYLGPTFIRSIVAGDGVLNANVANALPTANGRTSITMDDSGAGSSVLNLVTSQSIASLESTDTTSSVTLGANTLTIGFGSGLNVNGTAAANFAGVISDTQGVNSANVSVIKDDNSTEILSGTNTYNGATQVNAGTLSLQNGFAIVDTNKVIVTSPGILNLINSETIGSLAGNGSATLNANTLTTGGNGDTTTFSGVISGVGGSLVKTGSGTFTLSGANTFTGQTIVTGGILSLVGGAALSDVTTVTVNPLGTLNLVNSETIGALNGSGNTTLNANTLTTGGNNFTTTYSGVISGTGGGSALVKEGTGTMTFSGANTYTGTTTINAGVLSLANGNAIRDPNPFFDFSPVGVVIVNGGGTLDIADSETIGSVAGSGAITLNDQVLTTGGNNTSTTFSGVISDNVFGSIVKVGTGTFTLSGANTFQGTTSVYDGILRVASAAGLGATSGITAVGSGASLQIANGVTVNAEPLFISGSGFGGIGALTQDFNGSSTFTGPITLSSDSTISTNGVGTLTLTGGIDKDDTTLTLTGGGTIDINGVGISGVTNFTSDLIVDAVTVNENVANSYAGPTFIRSGGILNANVSDALPTAIVRTTITMDDFGTGSSQLNLGADQAIQSLQGLDASSQVNLDVNQLTIGTDLGGTTVFAGSINGNGGSIVKDGASTQVFAGNNTYTGGTTIDAGTLAAGSTKAFGNGDLTVNGGILRTEGGPLIVDIGAGNIQLNGGFYVANVGGTTPGVNHDQLFTQGTAAGNGGILVLVQRNNFLLSPGERVNLIIANGGVIGGTTGGNQLPSALVIGEEQFSNTPLLVPVVNAYTKAVVLEVEQGSFAALDGLLGLHCNTLAVAEALDSVAAENNFKTGVVKELDYLDVQPLETLEGNLDRISPEELTAVFDISKSLSNVQTANITRRLDDIRMSMLADEPATMSTSYSKDGKESKAVMPSQPSEQKRWGSFLNGSGEFTSVGNTNCASGYDLETGGVTLGVDYLFSNHFAAGVTFGYTNTGADLQNGGKVDVDGGRLGLYATYFTGGFYADTSVTGGLNSYDTKRSTPNGTQASASPDGEEINASIATGYDFKFGNLTVGPIASFQYTYTNLNGFTEKGDFAPLKIQSESGESARTALGMRASYDAKIGGVTIRPEIRASWQHEFSDTGYSLTSSFAELGGNQFTVEGPETGRDSLVVSAGVAVIWNQTYSAYVAYDGEIGRTNYDSHNVSAGFRVSF